MDIQQLKDQIKEVKEMQAELRELKERQVHILVKKKNELMEVIELFISEGVYFRHPQFDFYTGIGPVLGIEDSTNRVFIYNPKTNGLLLMGKDDTLEYSDKTTWLNLIDEEQFDNAIAGLDYLLDIQGKNLEIFDKEITRIKKQIERYN
ncbi:hypothetical protein NSQ36_12250 [Bacillus sp. FSL W8-1143]|uniref:hypothetical protein n=1 Tax=Bacillus sp. FSL W8-1143 TaxID=2954647 RepID=UPI0030D13D7B